MNGRAHLAQSHQRRARGGEPADWLDRAVRVPTLQILTLEQWIEHASAFVFSQASALTGVLRRLKEFSLHRASDIPR
jgi:hypothetical protein